MDLGSCKWIFGAVFRAEWQRKYIFDKDYGTRQLLEYKARMGKDCRSVPCSVPSISSWKGSQLEAAVKYYSLNPSTATVTWINVMIPSKAASSIQRTLAINCSGQRQKKSFVRELKVVQKRGCAVLCTRVAHSHLVNQEVLKVSVLVQNLLNLFDQRELWKKNIKLLSNYLYKLILTNYCLFLTALVHSKNPMP